MTDPDLTTQERVNKSIGTCRLHGLYGTAATLRALSAALAAEKEENRWAYIQAALDDQKDERSKLETRAEAAEAARDKWRSMWEREQTHNEDLEAKLRKAVDVLSGEDDRGYCLSPDARAFLASLEGDKP